MSTPTLDDVPDEIVQAVLEKLPKYIQISRDAAQGYPRLTLGEGPGGSHDIEVAPVAHHERVTARHSRDESV